MSLDPDTFRAVLGRFATGVTIVTMNDSDANAHGMTVSAFASLSLDPPLIIVCIDKTASVHDALVSCDSFAVNILSSAQEPIARRFAETGAQRFNGIGYRTGENGAPIIDDAVGYLECKRVASHPGGDHTLIIGETLGGQAYDRAPLAYYRGGFARLER